MANSASMALLKGSPAVEQELGDTHEENNKTPLAAVVNSETGAIPAIEESDGDLVVIENYKTHATLNALVATYGIETPDDWDTLTVAAKQAWFKDTFEDHETGDNLAEATALMNEANDIINDETAPATTNGESTPETTAAEVQDPTPVVAGKSSGKKAKAAVTADKKVLPDNDLVSIATEIAGLTKEGAMAAVSTLHDEANLNFIRMGGVLGRIQDENWYEPYASFQEMAEQKFGILKRRAYYWVSIYKGLVESEVPFSKVAHIPWSKLKDIVNIITPDTVDKWVKLAEECTSIQLQEHVKAHIAATKGLSDDDNVKTVISKTFKLHADQKVNLESALEKAKVQADTESDAVALDMLCMHYLGGPAGTAEALVTLLHAAGLEASLGAMEAAFPDNEFQLA